MSDFNSLFPDERETFGDPIDQTKYILLRILKIIDYVCAEHNLKYWLDYGTLLGAIRHDGYIPWDDDIDISMLREDYDKLIALGKDVFPADLFVQTKMSDPGLRKGIRWLKIRDRYSTAIESHEEGRDIKYHQGISLDIFPAEEFNNVELYLKAKWFTYSKVHIISKNKLASFFNKLLRKPHGKYVATGLEANFMTYFDREDIFPLSKVDFEGIGFSAPNNPQKVLSLRYGDYMKIPKVEDRVVHHSNVNATTACAHRESLDWTDGK